MFNVTVVDGKKILKFIIAIILLIALVFLLNQGKKIQNISEKINTNTYLNCIDETIVSFGYLNKSMPEVKEKESFITSILKWELGVKDKVVAKTTNETIEKNNEKVDEDDNKDLINTEIPDNITTEVLEENNIPKSFTNTYESVEIKNKSGYELTSDMLIPNLSLENKKDIIIFHTHTCESYTPSEKFNYQMTGNYRTTDSNYNVARVRKFINKIIAR